MTANTPSPAMLRLLQMPGVCPVTDDTLETFISSGLTALFFTGNEARYAEITDLAVILPQLMKVFPGAFSVGVVDPDAQKKTAMRYRVAARPTLLFLRDGAVLTSLGRLQDWRVYLEEVAAVLNTASEEVT